VGGSLDLVRIGPIVFRSVTHSDGTLDSAFVSFCFGNLCGLGFGWVQMSTFILTSSSSELEHKSTKDASESSCSELESSTSIIFVEATILAFRLGDRRKILSSCTPSILSRFPGLFLPGVPKGAGKETTLFEIFFRGLCRFGSLFCRRNEA